MRPYHKLVQDGIVEFGRRHMRDNVLSVSKGGERLMIFHGTKALNPIAFKPDRIFTLSDRSRIAFQVLESQAQKQREIEADIFRAYLFSGISKLVFIVPTNSDAENVSRLTSIVQDSLERLGIKKGLDLDLFLTLIIPRNAKTIKDILFYLNHPQVTRRIFGEL